jgi:hypothetical protein
MDYVLPLLLPFGSRGLGAWAQLSSSDSLLCVRGGLPAGSELAQLSSVTAPASNWGLTKLRVAVRDSSMFMLGLEEARGRVGRGGVLTGSTAIKAPVSGLVLAPIGHQNSFNMIAWWQKRRHRRQKRHGGAHTTGRHTAKLWSMVAMAAEALHRSSMRASTSAGLTEPW